ncbi:MAG: hypothetical protein JSR82_10690 [Verrucomicrobia bacterium]|nr:hypothetical protein [Verrucomicrobiota bacterium]
MKASPLLFAALAVCCLPACSKVKELDSTSRNTGRSFFGIGPKSKDSGIQMTADFSPKPVRAGTGKTMTVTIAIANLSKSQATLTNETGQRIEILLRETGGRVVTRWSESRSFDSKLTSSLINPGEKIEFVERVSTRDLRSGGSYELYAFVPGFEDRLRVVVPFTAQ